MKDSKKCLKQGMKKGVSAAMAAALAAGSVMGVWPCAPANRAVAVWAAETDPKQEKTGASQAKEEVVYITSDAGGTVKNMYVVNSFPGGEVTDYGEYSSVKILNTDGEISQNGDEIRISSDASSVYYQGELTETQSPWNISLRYFLDGKEYSPEEIAGKSGNLEIHFQVTKNMKCEGSFYEDYALQASFLLDTEQCGNVSASDATIANVGSSKQLTYTILPGEGIDTVLTADVTEFSMDAVSINGIQLNLNVDVDDAELKEKVGELIDATVKLDDGARELSSGTEELQDGSARLKDGTLELKTGMEDLDDGAAALQEGLAAVQNGLDALNAQSGTLTGGSKEFQAALATIQSAVNAVSVDSEELSQLTAASGQIRQALTELSGGAAALQDGLGYAQYQALMKENGLDIEELKAGNQEAVRTIEGYEAMLDRIGTIPGYESLVEPLKVQLRAAAEQIKTLLNANNAAIGGTEAYLNGLSGQLPALTEGLNTLETQYQTFDASISQLTVTLKGMTGNLSALADGINLLNETYKELDGGIRAYTDGTAQLTAGYSQVMDGVASLAKGTKTLTEGSGELYDKTAELYDGVVTLCDGAREMAEGTGDFRSQTADMDSQVDEEIDRLLETIGGSSGPCVSFISEKNTNVDAVQFVITTDAIEIEEEQTVQTTETEELSFWEKLMQLF